MHATAPLAILSAALVTAASSTTPHVPLGATGEQVQRLTLLPGPTLTSPARGVPAPAKTEIPRFDASLHAPPEPPQFQFKESLTKPPGSLTLRPVGQSPNTPFIAPAPVKKEPLPSRAPQFNETFTLEKNQGQKEASR